MNAFSTKHTRFLETLNSIPDGDKIKFEEVGHKYFAYSKYYTDWVSKEEGLGGLPIVSATGVLDKYFHFDRDGLALNIWKVPGNRHKMLHDPTYKYYGCTSVSDIIDKWSGGAIEGTKMHAIYEDLANLVEYDKANPDQASGLMMNLYAEATLGGYHEKAYFYEFVKQFKLDDPSSGMHFHRTELKLWHDVLHFTGTIDALLYNKRDNSYIIVDWKRCGGGVKLEGLNLRPARQLAVKSRGRGLEAFEGMRNSKLNRYGCQLTLYARLFEHMTGERISALYIVSVDSKKIGARSALKLIDIPMDKYKEAIRQAFEERAREMLSTCDSTLDSDHMDELIKYLDEGEAIRATRYEEEIKKRKREEEEEREEKI
jgi:hypothetical protein